FDLAHAPAVNRAGGGLHHLLLLFLPRVAGDKKRASLLAMSTSKQGRQRQTGPPLSFRTAEKGAAITRCRFDMSGASLQTCLFLRRASGRDENSDLQCERR